MLLRAALSLTPCLLLQANALVHQQVAFDSADVCWWGFVPPNLVCPILAQQNLTDLVNELVGRYEWYGGDACEDKFCLYSNFGFAGGRGIALITTDASYRRVKAVGDLLHEHDVSFDKDSASLPFHVIATDGNRESVIVDSPLQRGDPIMAHTPILLVHRAFIDNLPSSRQHALLDQALQRLPRQTARLFTSQTIPNHVLGQQDEQHRAATLLIEKSFKVNLRLGDDILDDSVPHYAAYPEAARIEHDCRPDATFYIDQTTLMHVTTAVRRINPGEHISLSYLDPLASHRERQAGATAAWGSQCGCQQCSPDREEDFEESETRLSEIKWIESKMLDDTSTEVSTGLIAYLLGLYENERLHCCVAAAYALAARNFNMLGFAGEAITYADLAIEALKIEKGESALEIAALQELRQAPKRHTTWKKRVKK